VSGSSRLDDLRRRVEKDPASIAFAQLAEEYRRAGELQQAVDICQAGLAMHPGYLSARVTLGRALIELNQLEDAEVEIGRVLKSAPDNLAAIRGLAEIHHRRGERVQALAQYRAALALAPNDPELQETVNDLVREVEPKGRAADPVDGLSLEQAAAAFSRHLPPPEMRRPAQPQPPAQPPNPAPAPVGAVSAPVVPEPPAGPTLEDAPALVPEPAPVVQFAVEQPVPEAPGGTRDERTVEALEAWLSAIDVARPNRQP
jgi:tetratricopeptide (TPR) repeat protein